MKNVLRMLTSCIAYLIGELIILIMLSLLAATCPFLSPPNNGSVSLTGVSIGDTATYTCDPGFNLVGTEVRTCEQIGPGLAAWSGSAPICLRRFFVCM